MSRGLIRTLIIVGLILLLLAAAFRWNGVRITGFIMIGVGLFVGLSRDGVLRKESVIDRWAVLIGNGQGKANEILKNTEHLIKESKAPSIRMEKRDITPGTLEKIMGKKREFLAVVDGDNDRLKPYQIFINARDYGNNLDVSWYLTYRPELWQAVLSLIPFVGAIPKASGDLDLFDEQDLRAYVTNAHHCLLEAVNKLMTDLQQDPSKIDRKSKGFLGIS